MKFHEIPEGYITDSDPYEIMVVLLCFIMFFFVRILISEYLAGEDI